MIRGRERLKELIENKRARGLPKTELARLMGVSPQHLLVIHHSLDPKIMVLKYSPGIPQPVGVVRWERSARGTLRSEAAAAGPGSANKISHLSVARCMELSASEAGRVNVFFGLRHALRMCAKSRCWTHFKPRTKKLKPS